MGTYHAPAAPVKSFFVLEPLRLRLGPAARRKDYRARVPGVSVIRADVVQAQLFIWDYS
jgi:hypothetical protein